MRVSNGRWGDILWSRSSWQAVKVALLSAFFFNKRRRRKNGARSQNRAEHFFICLLNWEQDLLAVYFGSCMRVYDREKERERERAVVVVSSPSSDPSGMSDTLSLLPIPPHSYDGLSIPVRLGNPSISDVTVGEEFSVTHCHSRSCLSFPVSPPTRDS